ncbi:MAG: hypothetical protein HY235_05310 [Acidobacteria bacterium]|nr:hypothetical protein [Acidobacteriota bacterium]
MPDAVDPLQFFEHLRTRWRFVAVAWLAALAIALGVSLAIPNKYTATCRILIEPPAGADVRASMAVSPIYLESLRTYEHFASSDSLFLRALDKFQLREQSRHRPVESWKRSVLEVTIPRNTKILEIHVTLGDPRKAHGLAFFIAEETVKLNQTVNRQGDEELAAAAVKQHEQARIRRENAEAAWSRLRQQHPVDSLEAEIDARTDAQTDLERQLRQEDLLAAEYAERRKASESATIEWSSARARAANLRSQIEELRQEIARKQVRLQEGLARREQLDVQRKAAQASLESAESRLRDTGITIGYRGERLKIIDPGIVPERPSFPNLPLNLVAAWLLATLLSLAWLAVEFSVRSRSGEAKRPALRVASRSLE